MCHLSTEQNCDPKRIVHLNNGKGFVFLFLFSPKEILNLFYFSQLRIRGNEGIRIFSELDLHLSTWILTAGFLNNRPIDLGPEIACVSGRKRTC